MTVGRGAICPASQCSRVSPARQQPQLLWFYSGVCVGFKSIGVLLGKKEIKGGCCRPGRVEWPPTYWSSCFWKLFLIFPACEWWESAWLQTDFRSALTLIFQPILILLLVILSPWKVPSSFWSFVWGFRFGDGGKIGREKACDGLGEQHCSFGCHFQPRAV